MFLDIFAAHESLRASAGLLIFLAAVGLKLVLARVLPLSNGAASGTR